MPPRADAVPAESEEELAPRAVSLGPEPEDEELEVPGTEPTAIDTHCHLFLMEHEPVDVVTAARVGGVARLVCVGIDPETSRRSLELAESFRGVFATAGMHPHTASAFDRQAGSTIEELLAHPMVVAVGETGLDYYRLLSPAEDQRAAFRTHIAMAREAGKPLVVHVRDAWDDAFALLAEERAESVVLHCFSGDEGQAREAAARGYHLSFAGNITYPGAEDIRRAAAAVEEDRLLAETDSPFLAPQVVRGTPNAPVNVLAVIGALAEIRGAAVDSMVARTTRSALEAMPLLR